MGDLTERTLVADLHAVLVEDGIELPSARQPSELVRSTILELQAGPRHHVPHGTGHQHLARSGPADHPGARVDRDPSDLAAVSDALPGVQTCPSLQSELGKRDRDRAGAPDRRGRRVEGREEAVAGVIDLTSPPPIEEFADPPMVRPQEQGPPPVSERGRQTCRADQVGEEQRDQDAALSPVRGHSSVSLFLVHDGPSLPFLSAVPVKLPCGWSCGEARS